MTNNPKDSDVPVRLLPKEYQFLIGGWNEPTSCPTEKDWLSCYHEGWIDGHSHVTPLGRKAITEYQTRNGKSFYERSTEELNPTSEVTGVTETARETDVGVTGAPYPCYECPT